MNPLDRAHISKLVRGFLDKRRPPAHLRDNVDFAFRFHGRTVELIEIRARMGGGTGKVEHPFAKATYVKTTEVWKVYWMRASLKWHPYEPSTVGSLEAFLRLVDEDKHHCFFG